MASAQPTWNPDFADDLVHATVLVGITYHKPEGERHDQFFGTVTQVDECQGITLRLAGERRGEFFQLPPNLGAFTPAEPATYQLHDTGEIVTDPDYVVTWEVTSRAH